MSPDATEARQTIISVSLFTFACGVWAGVMLGLLIAG